MLKVIKHIIWHMIDFAKRWGPQFLLAFAALTVGSASIPIWLHGEWQVLASILLGILSFICLVSTCIALVYDIKEARRKDKEAKKEKDFQALKESFKRMGLSDEQAEISARGRK
jgi:hypothetical protein